MYQKDVYPEDKPCLVETAYQHVVEQLDDIIEKD
jgi:hypothetical protein